MSSESELRDAIRSSANITTTGIDTDAVVRRARARRVPKQFAFSSLSVLAIAGIVTLGISTLPALQPGPDGAADSSIMSTMPESMPSDAGGDSTAKNFDARELTQNLCGSATMSTEPNSTGLVLWVNFPDSSPADGQDVVGTVSLTNTGSSHVSGTTAIAPSITVSRDGITVWHSHGAMRDVGVLVDLDPGQSYSYDSYFTAVECAPEDDESGQFRDNLPPLAAGQYEISAEIIFMPKQAESGESILVGGPVQNLELH